MSEWDEDGGRSSNKGIVRLDENNHTHYTTMHIRDQTYRVSFGSPFRRLKIRLRPHKNQHTHMQAQRSMCELSHNECSYICAGSPHVSSTAKIYVR